jgi:prepilin-type N-terminal cleavage/methylation domain-containing protein
MVFSYKADAMNGEGNMKRKLQGFTLVELIVAMGVLSIMASVTIVSMGGAKTKQEVEGAARQVAAAIREAQNYALTGKNIGAAGDVPCRFHVTVANTSPNVTIQQIKFDSSGVCNTNSGSMVYSLQHGVVFSANAEVRFDVPRGEPRNSAGTEIGISGVTHVGFSFAKSGSTAHVCVYPLGRIEEKIGVNCI